MQCVNIVSTSEDNTPACLDWPHPNGLKFTFVAYLFYLLLLISNLFWMIWRVLSGFTDFFLKTLIMSHNVVREHISLNQLEFNCTTERMDLFWFQICSTIWKFNNSPEKSFSWIVSLRRSLGLRDIGIIWNIIWRKNVPTSGWSFHVICRRTITDDFYLSDVQPRKNCSQCPLRSQGWKHEQHLSLRSLCKNIAKLVRANMLAQLLSLALKVFAKTFWQVEFKPRSLLHYNFYRPHSEGCGKGMLSQVSVRSQGVGCTNPMLSYLWPPSDDRGTTHPRLRYGFPQEDFLEMPIYLI